MTQFRRVSWIGIPLWCCGPVGLLAALLAGGILSQSTCGQTASPTGTSDLERACTLLNEARRRFHDVQDYECTVVKRERVNGALLPESLMFMKIRERPFSVYLFGLAPDSEKGQEVCYVTGRNKGMMRVHPAGLLGIIGFVSVDPYDPRAFKENRHPITEAGIGNLLEATARYWEMERRGNQTLARITDDSFQGRPCTRIETIHPDRNAGRFYAYRCVLCLDNVTHLPVHAAAYDWPRPGGPSGGDLLEWYGYLDIRCNVGLGDAAFNHYAHFANVCSSGHKPEARAKECCILRSRLRLVSTATAKRKPL